PSDRMFGSVRESVRGPRSAKSFGSPFVNTEGSNQCASRSSSEPDVKWDSPVLVGRAQGTFGMPELLSAPGQPPIIIGKPLWKVMIVLIPHPEISLLVTPVKLLAYFLPLPNGRSNTEAITKRCGTSNVSKLRSWRRSFGLASFQLTGLASSQLISELVLSMSFATV